MSTHNGRITPIDPADNPLQALVAQWRAAAAVAESDIATQYAAARATSLRQCADALERVMGSVRAIVRV